MEPLVSVIIPVYNVLPYLREALDSVINQTYKNLEILIVDDGSTDGSGDVCDEYLFDPRVIVIHQENKGLSGARNTGLDRVTGEFVAFLDSDDAFMPEMIEKMLSTMIQNDAEMTICEFSVCISNSKMSIKEKNLDSQLIKKDQLLNAADALNLLVGEKIGWYVWNKLYKRTVWNGIHFPMGDNYEDLRVMGQIFTNCKRITSTLGLLLLHRQWSGSITASVSEKNIQDYVLAIKTMEVFILNLSPTICPPEKKHLILEQYARSLSIQYARLLFNPCSIRVKKQIRLEALSRWNLLKKEKCLFRSNLTCFLFIYAPIFIIPTDTCWRNGKKFLQKINPLTTYKAAL